MTNRRRGAPRNGDTSGMDVDGQGPGADKPVVEIRNWQGAPTKDLVAFVKRKVRVTLLGGRAVGAVFTARCEPSETAALLQLDNARFAGNTLQITINSSGTDSGAAGGTIGVLTSFLQSRYDAGAKLLNLSLMKTDQYLLQHGLFASPTTSSKMFPALMKLAGDLIPDVVSVSLESNDLTDVSPVTTLAQTYPRLVNLSLANNNITSITGLSPWRNKFTTLRELVLTGNPVAAQTHAIVQMFPRLVVLDGAVVRDEASLPVNKLPTPIVSRFFENDAIAEVAQDFLHNFYRLWDSNRAELLPLYDDMSEFSITFDTDSPRLPGPTSSAAAYFAVSRNLARNNTFATRQKRLALGSQAVGELFKKLPASQHNLANPATFAIDAWQVSDIRAPGDTGIMIVVHGDFTESQSNAARSFDRAMIMILNPQGAMIVASDMLTVRNPSDGGVFQSPQNSRPAPAATPVAPAAGVPAPSPVVAPGANGTQSPMGSHVSTPQPTALQGADVIQALMQQTRLNLEYASMCAQQANYDFNQALALFEQSRPNLPPNAFV